MSRSLKQLEAELKRHPQSVEHLHQAAGLSFQQGQPERARRYLRRALKLAPAQPALWNDLGGLALAAGDAAEAARCFAQVLELAPGFLEARVNLGHAQHAQGLNAEAKASFSGALQAEPEHVRARYNLAVLCQEEGDFDAAAEHYRRVLRTQPGLAQAQFNLAQCFTELGRNEAAAGAYRETLRLEPERAEARLGLGRALVSAWFTEEGLEHLRAFVALKPDSLAGRLQLANALQVAGDMKAAEAEALRATELAPRSSAAWFRLASIVSFARGHDEALTAMEALLAQPDMSDADRTHLHFALGKAWDERRDYERAFQHYSQGNALKWAGLDHDTMAKRHGAQVADIITHFTPEVLESLTAFGLDSALPVLVVGMPRSGTTLTEQILAAHPRAQGAGELSYFNTLIPHLERVFEGVRPYPQGAADLQEATARRVAEPYLALLRRHSPTADRVVDKMPGNYLYLGIIAGLFPRASLIHCSRNAEDTCLSIFFQLFAQGHDYAYDLRALGERYRQYRRLMRHWQALLGERLYEHSYEALVAEPEAGARALVQAAGLDWAPECLAFHQRKASVRTASVSQVRQPLYSRSRERWRNYEPWLGPLLEALGED